MHDLIGVGNEGNRIHGVTRWEYPVERGPDYHYRLGRVCSNRFCDERVHDYTKGNLCIKCHYKTRGSAVQNLVKRLLALHDVREQARVDVIARAIVPEIARVG